MSAAAAGLLMPRPEPSPSEEDDDLDHGLSPQQEGKRDQSGQTAGEDEQFSSAPVGLTAKIDVRQSRAASVNQVDQSYIRGGEAKPGSISRQHGEVEAAHNTRPENDGAAGKKCVAVSLRRSAAPFLFAATTTPISAIVHLRPLIGSETLR